MGREPLLLRIAPLTSLSCDSVVLCGISNRFRLLSPSKGQVAHALLTRSPLSIIHAPFDLHVLGTPPAFVLSQDQTLELKSQQFSLSLTFQLASHFFKTVVRFIAGSSNSLRSFLALYSSQGAVRCPFSSLFSLVPRDSLFSIANHFPYVNRFFKNIFVFGKESMHIFERALK